METIRELPEDHAMDFECVVVKQERIYFKEEDSLEGQEFPYRPGTLELCTENEKEQGGLDAENTSLIQIKTEEIDLKEEDTTLTDKFICVESELENVVQTMKKDPDEVDSKCKLEDVIPIPLENPCLEPKVEIAVSQQTDIISVERSSNLSVQNQTEEWIADAANIQQNASTTIYTCGHCKISYSQLSDMKLHMKIHNKGTLYSSRQDQSNLQGETKIPYGRKPFSSTTAYTCGHCKVSYSQLSDMKLHMKVHSEESRYLTRQDESNLQGETNIPCHGKPFSCNECGKLFSFKSGLDRHMNFHSGYKPFSCNECGKSFSQKSTLKGHMIVHSGDKPFCCNECGKLFSHFNTLKGHLNTHSGHKPFSCNECGKSFSFHSNLKYHMKTHSGDKPFSCNECGQLFTHQRDLKVHMYIHGGRKPFSCNQCGKSFLDKSHLIAHTNIHYGIKPFSCKLCGKLFTTKQPLKRHMNVHTGYKPFSCSECGKSFSEKRNLKVHVEIHCVRNTKPLS